MTSPRLSVTRRLSRSALALTAGAALVLAGAVTAPSASAHQTDRSETSTKRQQFTDGVSVPVISSPNIRFVGNFPDTAAISGVFAKSAPYFYVSSTDSITVFDVSDPVHPRPTGVLPNLVFENEAMNYGEKLVDGVVNRFVLVGADLVEYSPTDPAYVAEDNEMMVVDVTDPANPYIRSRLKTQTNTHTVSCLEETNCQYAYTAGRNGQFSVVDLSDLDNPREAGVFTSPAGGPNARFKRGAGHKWNFDDAGYGVHTGSGGSAIFDVSDPTAPRVVATTDANGVTGPWNNFIHHNAARPNAFEFDAGQAPNLSMGNSCSSPRRTTRTPTAQRRAASSPGTSRRWTGAPAPSRHWTASTRSTSARACRPRTWLSARPTGSTCTRAASSPRATTRVACA